MIITPHELQQWVSAGRSFIAADIRPEEQRHHFPISGLEAIIASAEDLPTRKKEPLVLICQFGILTEELIVEQNLENSYSLLGGVQSWEAYQTDKMDLSRWSRQTILSEIGTAGQRKLQAAQITIVGLGGLGCPAAQSLAASGVGTLRLVDGDVIELSNLHRQTLYGINDIGQAKVSVALKSLQQLNEKLTVIAEDRYLDESNGQELLKDAGVIIDATRSIKTRQEIDRISKTANIPMVYGGLYRFEGQVAVLNHNGSPGYEEIFTPDPSGGDTCAEAGVLGMLPAIIGNIQALEAVKIIIGIKPNLSGNLLLYDGITHETNIIKIGGKA
mgnify:CR=1 FL=1